NVPRTMFCDQLPGDFANRVISRVNSEQNLCCSRIILRQPAFQAVQRFAVGVLQWFQKRDRWRKTLVRGALMKWKSQSDDELPKRQREAEERERCQNDVQHHAWFLTRINAVKKVFPNESDPVEASEV